MSLAWRAFPPGRAAGILTRMSDATPSPAQPAAGPAGAEIARLRDDEGQALFGFARRLGLSDEQADDAVQEVLARMLSIQRGGVVIANARAWAFRSIYRLAMDEHRLRTRMASLIDRLHRHPPRQAPDATDRIAVWTEVERLPQRQRQVIYLRYRADLSYDDIGQALGITDSAARSHAAQAMTTLRARLADTIEELA